MTLNIPTSDQQDLQVGAKTTEIKLTIPPVAESRLQVQLRTTIPVTKVELINPKGITVVANKDTRIVFQDHSALKDPNQGDFIIIPEQINPVEGSWILRLTHQSARKTDKVVVTSTLFERYLLNIVSFNKVISEGQDVLLKILITDFGQPIKGLSPKIEVIKNGTDFINSLSASENLLSLSGIRLSDEEGVYIAHYTPSSSGTYQFKARIALNTDKGTTSREAYTEVNVEPSSIHLANVIVKPIKKHDSCIEKIEFLVDLFVKTPGTYTVSLLFNSNNAQDFEISSSREAKGNERLTFSLLLDSADALKSIKEDKFIKIKNISILRFNSDSIDSLGNFQNPVVDLSIAFNDLCDLSPN